METRNLTTQYLCRDNCSDFRLNVVKKPFIQNQSNHSTYPITKDTDNPVNQSRFEASTCNRRKARENVCEQVTNGFGFTFDWLNRRDEELY